MRAVPETASRAAPSILTFIIADMAIFAVFFGLFTLERLHQTAVFSQATALLNPQLGLLNTLILVSSGWQVVLAVEAMRAADRGALRRHLMGAMVLGAGFAVTKLSEYHDKFAHGINLLSNDFFTFYFVLTGVHFLHYLVGMAVLLLLWLKAAGEPLDGPLRGWIVSAGLYWHMVDLLWILLFPMLYLQR